MTTVNFGIEGTSPLLMHRFIADERNVKRSGERPTPEEEVEAGLYRTKDGTIHLPGDCIKASVKTVASMVRIPGRGKETLKKYVPAGLVVSAINPVKPQEFEVDARGVIINRARIVRYRPRFDTWYVEGTMELLDPNVTTDRAKELLELAGRISGVGDNRGNGFGRFAVTKWKVLTDSR